MCLAKHVWTKFDVFAKQKILKSILKKHEISVV